MKAIWLIHSIIATLSLNLHVISTSGHSDDLSSTSSTATKINSDKSAPSSLSSWFDNTGVYPNSLKPKLFQLPYEKITNPLSSFISWITQNDRNVRTYDQLYLSGKSTGQRSPSVMGSSGTLNKEKGGTTKPTSSSLSLSSSSPSSSSPSSSPMTSSSNINPLAVRAPSMTVSPSSLSSLSSAMFPSFKSWPVNNRRQDLLSSFSFSRSSFAPSASVSSSVRSNIFGSKDLSASPQFTVTFPRSTPPKDRQLSPETLGIIAKYNPNPKVFFIPKYYTSPYSVSVPFITHADKLLIASNHRVRVGDSRGADNVEEDNYGEESVDYDRDEHRNVSIENDSFITNDDHSYRHSHGNKSSDRYRRNHQRRRNRQKDRKSFKKQYSSFTSNQSRSKSKYSVADHTTHKGGDNGLKSAMLLPRAQTNNNKQSTSKRYRSRNKPSSSFSSSFSSSSPWRAMNSNEDTHRPAPYTGKAQYSTIDNSSDPMSPSASRWIPFWTKRRQ